MFNIYAVFNYAIHRFKLLYIYIIRIYVYILTAICFISDHNLSLAQYYNVKLFVHTLSLTRFEFLGNSKIDLILHCPFYDYQKSNYGRLRQKCIIVWQLYLIKSTYLLWCLFPVKNKSIFIFNLQRKWDKQIYDLI
jgi:hypothetical protein